MTDREAEGVLGALADMPLLWLQKGVRFVLLQPGAPRGEALAGVVVRRDADCVYYRLDCWLPGSTPSPADLGRYLAYWQPLLHPEGKP